jgi:hypothetical protein
MVWVYYDESGEYDGGGNLLNMSVAGCLASLDRWEAFQQFSFCLNTVTKGQISLPRPVVAIKARGAEVW